MSASMSPLDALGNMFGATTRLSQALAATLGLGYLVQLVYAPTRMYLAMVAGRTLPCVWNVVTAGLLEQHVFTMILSVTALLALSRVIEPVYGSREYLKFLAIVNAAAGVGAFFTVYVVYALHPTEEGNLLYSEISGFHGVLAGMLVAIKQLTPETEITVLQIVKLRAKHLAALYVLTASVLSVLTHRAVATIPFVMCGALSAWVYLRLYQPSPTDASQQGDNSPEFRFATFFPAPMHPVVDRVSGAAAPLLSRLGFAAAGTSPGTAAASTMPAATSAEASRRRERGARALEERLGLKSTVAVSREAVSAPPADVEAGLSGGNGDKPASEEPPLQAA